MTVYFGEIETFPNARADRAQVLKIIEECVEVYAAWEEFDNSANQYGIERDRLLAECADVAQALANLCAGLSVHNFTLYLEECERRNRKRGRYDA